LSTDRLPTGNEEPSGSDNEHKATEQFNSTVVCYQSRDPSAIKCLKVFWRRTKLSHIRPAHDLGALVIKHGAYAEKDQQHIDNYDTRHGDKDAPHENT